MNLKASLWVAAGFAAVALSGCGSSPVPDNVVQYSSLPIQCRTDGECQQDWARLHLLIQKTGQSVVIDEPAVIQTKGTLPAANDDHLNRAPSLWTFSRKPNDDGVTDSITIKAACGMPRLCTESAPDIARVKHYLITGLGL